MMLEDRGNVSLAALQKAAWEVTYTAQGQPPLRNLITSFSAASQQAIGTVVLGGMLSSTLIAIPFVPVFYVLMEKLSAWRQK